MNNKFGFREFNSWFLMNFANNEINKHLILVYYDYLTFILSLFRFINKFFFLNRIKKLILIY